jgi:glycerophosphoryl diester phosphodiesterase
MKFNSNRRIIVAHRGWSGVAPENTMAAFRLAMADPRISWIELDVQLSKDGVPVVIHDYKLRRTTGASGAVKDYTFKQLSKLDNGSWFSPEFHNERIPTLEQVLKETKGRIHLNIELKTKDNLYPGLEKAVINLVQAYSIEADVVITSFDTHALKTTKLLAPSIRTGLITSIVPITIRDQLRILGADLLSMDYRIVEPTFVHSMVESGFDVMVWTVNEPRAIEQMVSLHPKLRICTNYPDRVFPL